MNIKPGKYIMSNGQIIDNKGFSIVAYNNEKIVERTLIEFYNDKMELIGTKVTDKDSYEENELLYLCLINNASRCRISMILEVEYES